jgi:cytoskeletal protein CcmA (bactofilin family)
VRPRPRRGVEMSDDEETGKAPGAPTGAEPPLVACLGPECELEGKLRFRGWLRIEGVVVGELIGDNLVVGPTGRVKADLSIGQLVVEGQVEGTVHASQAVEIRHRGQLRGEVETPSLFIDRGVVFEGRCRVTDPQQPEDPVSQKTPSERPGD